MYFIDCSCLWRLEHLLLLLLLPGEVLRSMKQFAAGCHNRDQLMAVAFNGIGGLPRARIAKLQKAEAKRVRE